MSIRRRLRSILWRVPVEQEVREELAHHIEMRARELVDRGLTPSEARAEARRRLGDLGRLEADLVRLGTRRDRALAIREWLADLGQDTVLALRLYRRSPGFTAGAVLTLALGLGAATSVFSIVHAVVLKPFPFPDPDRVLLVYTTWRGGMSDASVGNYEYIRRRTTTLEHLAAVNYASFNLADEGAPERVLGLRTTWDYFRVFGIAPLHGRTYTAEEDQPGRNEVVVLSHRLWARRFGADAAWIGRSIRLSGKSYTVIGVMPREFDEVGDAEDLWVPIAFTPEQLAEHDGHYLALFGLRRQGRRRWRRSTTSSVASPRASRSIIRATLRPSFKPRFASCGKTSPPRQASRPSRSTRNFRSAEASDRTGSSPRAVP
jgi:hypothetical protein